MRNFTYHFWVLFRIHCNWIKSDCSVRFCSRLVCWFFMQSWISLLGRHRLIVRNLRRFFVISRNISIPCLLIQGTLWHNIMQLIQIVLQIVHNYSISNRLRQWIYFCPRNILWGRIQYFTTVSTLLVFIQFLTF